MSCHQPFKAHQNLRFYFSWKSPSHLSSWACQTAQRVSCSQQVPDTGFHTQTAPSEKLTKTYRAHWPSHIWCMCLLSPHFKQDPAMNMLRNVCVCFIIILFLCSCLCFVFFQTRQDYWKFLSVPRTVRAATYRQLARFNLEGMTQ